MRGGQSVTWKCPQCEMLAYWTTVFNDGHNKKRTDLRNLQKAKSMGRDDEVDMYIESRGGGQGGCLSLGLEQLKG